MRTIKNSNPECFLGAHLSIAKGLPQALYKAKALGCNALQIFTKNASTWKERILSKAEIDSFKATIKKTGIKSIASHTSYLINLATLGGKKHVMACNALKQELVRSSLLDIPYVVLHPGSHMGIGEKEGIRQIAESLNQVLDAGKDCKPRILLETTAGQGTSLGYTFHQLASIMDQVKIKDKIGVCIDTCHIFAAGYDIRTESLYNKTIDSFNSIVGIDNLYLLHLNDSKKDLNSRVDRHEHIGQGFIGGNAFKLLMNDSRFSQIPKIIETPKEKKQTAWDKTNLNLLRSYLES